MPEISVPIRRRGALVKLVVRPPADPSAGVGPFAAFVDTGASDTMLELGFLRDLRVEPVRATALSVLGRDDASFHDLFEVEVALAVPEMPPRWVPLTVLGGPVFRTGAVAALGRDFLGHVVFTYDGPGRRAVLRW